MSDSGAGSNCESLSEVECVRATCTGNWLSHLDWDGARCGRCLLCATLPAGRSPMGAKRQQAKQLALILVS